MDPLSLYSIFWQRPTLPCVPHTVPSALTGLTSGFGMEPGVTPSQFPPKNRFMIHSLTWRAVCMPSAYHTVKYYPAHHHIQTKGNKQLWRKKPRLISTGRLNASQRLHPRPIYPVVFRTSYFHYWNKVSHLGGGFPLRCFQRLSGPNMATRLMRLAPQPVH